MYACSVTAHRTGSKDVNQSMQALSQEAAQYCSGYEGIKVGAMEKIVCSTSNL